MADNTTLNTMTGGDVYRSKDRTGTKTSIVALDLNPGGSETLMGGTMPCTQSGTWTVQPGNTANTTPWLATVSQGGNSATVGTSMPSASAAALSVREAGAGFISTNNSTTATLANGAAFTGTADDVTEYASATIMVFANQVSATDGLSIQQSSDGTNWDISDTYTIPASTGKTFSVQITARYMRIVYTNGGVTQGSFRMQTIYHKWMQPTASVRPQDARSNENDMGETVAYMAIYNGTTWDRARGDTTSGQWVNVKNVGRAAAASSIPVVLSTEDANSTSITGQGSQTTLNNNIVLASAGSGSTDCAAYSSITLQIIQSAGTVTAGAITFEGSNDNSTFVAVPLYDSASPNNLPISTFSCVAATNRMFSGPIRFRYFRARISTGLTGTNTGVQCYTSLGLYPFVPFGSTQVANQTGSNLNVAIASGTVTTVSTVTAIGTSVTPGTSAAHLGKAEDAVAGSGDTGVAVWGVRRDTPATNVNAAGDYAEIPVSSTGTLWCSLTPTTGGGWSISKLIGAGSTNATNAKASAGIVGGWFISNIASSVRYVKLYNKASSPTVGTDTPVMTLAIPAGGAANIELANGITFATGIGYATTTGYADNDTGAITAGDVIVNLLYK